MRAVATFPSLTIVIRGAHVQHRQVERFAGALLLFCAARKIRTMTLKKLLTHTPVIENEWERASIVWWQWQQSMMAREASRETPGGKVLCILIPMFSQPLVPGHRVLQSELLCRRLDRVVLA